jgi:hypothetical protein
MTPTYPRHSGFGLFFGPESFSVGIVGHQGFPVSVGHHPIGSRAPLARFKACGAAHGQTSAQVSSEVLPSASIAPYALGNWGGFLGFA